MQQSTKLSSWSDISTDCYGGHHIGFGDRILEKRVHSPHSSDDVVIEKE